MTRSGLAALLVVTCVVGATAASRTTSGEPLFRDGFSGTALEPGWELDAQADTAIELSEGRLRIGAPINQFAHLERPLDRDLVTVTALMQPSIPSGVSWSCGVFLYWDVGAWCQLSIIDFEDGQYFVAEAAGGRERPSYLDRCDRSRPHRLRIELGVDCVRYLARAEGVRKWHPLRTARRPPEWAGPPRLLILGKGFSSCWDPAYPAPDLDNNYTDPGPVATAWFDEVTVAATPPARQELGAGELPPSGDVVGERILSLPGDPTHEQVASVYPGLRHPREAVGVKWHPHEVGVSETGAVELGLANTDGQLQPIVGCMVVSDGKIPFGSGVLPRKSLLDGHLPVVVAEWTHQGVNYEQTVLGHSQGLSADAPLYAYISLKATSRSGPRSLPITFRVAPEGVGVEPRRHTLQVRKRAAAEWSVRVPCPFAQGAAAEVVEAGEMDRVVDETRSFWRQELARGTQISLPDARLMNAHRAWLAYNAINVDHVRGHPRAHDGAGFYEDVFGCSAARYAWVLDLYGLHADAEAILEGLLADQKPDGLFEWHGGLIDHGATLLALAEHYRLTRDAAWLQRVTPAMVAGCEWVQRRRQEQREPGTLTDGLIRHRPYCDYIQPVCGYLHNAFCCAGMERVAAVLQESGSRGEAMPIATETARYRADILRSMRAATFRRHGREILPMEPDTHRLLKDGSYEAGEYYGLVASTLLESGFLAPRSREAALITSFLREEGGLRMGLCEFCGLTRGLRGAHTGIDHAYTYGYLENQLILGNAERYVLGLWASLAYGMARETFSSVECTQLVSGENEMTLPHLYSGTQQLLMLRTMLVREEGDRLVLCSAVPRQWLTEGKRIEVRDAVTRFGAMGFRLVSSEDGAEVRASIDGPTRGRPREIVLHLRQATGQPLRSVTVNGQRWHDFDMETIALQPSESPIAVVARFGAP